MKLSDFSLNLYRKTVKKFYPAHVASHWLMERLIIPIMEQARDFKTVPDDPFWFRLELLTGRHEPETIQQLDRLVQPGMTMLDIGAHVGYYAARYAPVVGNNGRIIAFEPHPRTFKTLEHNLRRRRNVTPLQLALAESAGEAELHDYLIMSASGSLHYNPDLRDQVKSRLSDSDIAPRLHDDLPAMTYTVKTEAVDVILDELGISQVDVVKMDIEGAEIGALRGMTQTITRSPNLQLIMEYNPHALQSFGHDPAAALQEVMDMGFAHVAAIETDGSLTPLTNKWDTIRTRTEQLQANLGVLNLLLTR